MKRKPALASRFAFAAVLAAVVAFAPAHAADWKPDRNVEIIVPTGPGSGVDDTARTLQTLMQGAKLVEAPMSITNRPGGSYGVALTELGMAAK